MQLRDNGIRGMPPVPMVKAVYPCRQEVPNHSGPLLLGSSQPKGITECPQWAKNDAYGVKSWRCTVKTGIGQGKGFQTVVGAYRAFLDRVAKCDMDKELR